MNRKLYFKLAFTNIKNNRVMFLPYVITCIVIIALFYTINSLVNAKSLTSISGGNFTIDVMKFGSLMFTVLSLFFLIYTNSFIFKRRKKEFGLYHLLGLEKKHIKKLLMIENLMIASISIISGILVGLVFNKLVGIFMFGMMKVSLVLEAISFPAVYKTIGTFIVIFIIIHFTNLKQIHSNHVMELIKGSQIGEKEPKVKFVWAILGGTFLLAGYIFSFTVTDPKEELSALIMAIVFIIFATYLLFIAVSIVLLKMLRKKETIYYRKENFTLISTMLYRMKQNAVGLSNITVLSTATLIVMTTTISLYLGINTMLNNTFQYDVSIKNEAASDVIGQQQLQILMDSNKEKYGVEIKTPISYRGGQFAADLTGDGKEEYFFVLPLNDYNELTKKNIQLEANEVLLLQDEETATLQAIQLENTSLKVKDTVNELPIDTSKTNSKEAHWIYIVAPLTGELALQLDIENSLTMYQVFNLKGTKEAVNEFSHAIANEAQTISNVDVEAKSIYKESLLVRFSGLLFLGVFISTVLFAETALMIYYKQISEGYDDRKRFSIMKKVGMNRNEIKETIRKQTLIMFFAPLVVALLHLAVGIPLVIKIIGIAGMDNWIITLGSAIFASLIFIVIYGAVFIFTEKSYKKIVER